MNAMENLISPEEVALQAFAPLDRVTPADVNPLTIAVAQERFIVPVLGAAMVEALAAGSYAELLNQSVAPALALYTRVLMIPALALRIGSVGVSRSANQYLDAATENELRSLRRTALAQAATLLQKAVTAIESAPDRYPEYDAHQNIWHSCRTDGGVVL